MCNNCCVNCPKRDYEACKNCKKDKKFELIITADDLNSLHTENE